MGRQQLLSLFEYPVLLGAVTLGRLDIIVGGKGGIEASLSGSAALITAWGICTLILMSGRYAGKFLGTKALSALESLMGLLLTTMAFEMMIKGIKLAFHLK